MSSVVFYKFINEKEPSRISFDGTGISVFELKRDIIKQAQLGDGTDFDLVIFHQGTKDEYTDDTTIVPRSSQVDAKRVRATRPGQGRAARYVSGKMPTIAKASYRAEAPTMPPTGAGAPAFSEGQTEEERLAAMLKAGDSVWEQEKAKMANATPVFFNRSGPKPAPVAQNPENNKPPPPGYLCHRCLQKGHYIQNCPTNGDPTFDQRRRVKRITGIPRSLMQAVDENEAEEDDGDGDDKKPATIMVNVDGKRVRALADEASWAQYKAKNDAAGANKEDANQGSEELRALGLECPHDNRLFVNPVKMPCCGKTYCSDCAENVLLDSDLTCPSCGTEGVVLDDLTPDKETSDKIRAYEDDKKKRESADGTKRKSTSPGPQSANSPAKDDSTAQQQTGATNAVSSAAGPAAESDQPTPEANPRKRAAEEELSNSRQGSAPVAMDKSKSHTSEPHSPRPATAGENSAAPVNAPKGPAADRNSMNGMNFPMGNFPMANMMNPMMMSNPMMMMSGFGANFGGMNAMNMNGMGAMGMNGMNGMNFGGMDGTWNQGLNNWNNGAATDSNNNHSGIPTGPRAHQNTFKTGFNGNPNMPTDSPYERAPVNPHRGSRQRKVRQADYKEL